MQLLIESFKVRSFFSKIHFGVETNLKIIVCDLVESNLGVVLQLEIHRLAKLEKAVNSHLLNVSFSFAFVNFIFNELFQHSVN